MMAAAMLEMQAQLIRNLSAGMGAMGPSGCAPPPPGLMQPRAAPLGGPPPPLTSGMSTRWKLFVGQVPYEADEQHLIPLFAPFGSITHISVLRKPGTAQSRGCAFVSFATQAQARAAIEALSGKVCVPGDPRNKPLVVNYANVRGS